MRKNFKGGRTTWVITNTTLPLPDAKTQATLDEMKRVYSGEVNHRLTQDDLDRLHDQLIEHDQEVERAHRIWNLPPQTDSREPTRWKRGNETE